MQLRETRLKFPQISALFLTLLLLSHCASKHQPLEFSAYFADRPDNEFTPRLLSESKALERKTKLSLLEKKRLYDLYDLERKTLNSSSARAVYLYNAQQPLAPTVVLLQREMAELSKEAIRPQDAEKSVTPSHFSFENAKLKKQYSEISQLWNRDESEEAFRKLALIISGDIFKSSSTAQERYKIWYLQFRIALELKDWSTAERAYLSMRSIDRCAENTTQAAFLLAIRLMKDRGDRALEIFSDQCDNDDSPTHRLQRSYWTARFTEFARHSKIPELYETAARSRIPSYYVYLARRHQKSNVNLLPVAVEEDNGAQDGVLRVPGDVNQLLIAAELRLQANLRRDASWYLEKAARKLTARHSKEDGESLLYVAHLLQAAGNHIEAIRLFSLVSAGFDDTPKPTDKTLAFLRQMFPRPFAVTVEWLARQWEIDPNFIYAIMRQESAFNPAALSPAHARGLMQLLPSLARQISRQWGYEPLFTDHSLFTASENLKIASYHLSRLQMLAPHPVLVAAAYNAGMKRVAGWWKKFGDLPVDAFVETIPVAETRNYAKLVLRNWLYYKSLAGNGTIDDSVVSLELPPFGGTAGEAKIVTVE